MDDKHHYACLPSLAAMMIAFTTHHLHVKPGLTGHLTVERKDLRRRIMTTIMRVDDKHDYASVASLAATSHHPAIFSSENDKHDYALLACQAGSNGTLETFLKNIEKI